MPNIADSPAAALPLQPTDRLYGERAGQAVKEFQLGDITALAQQDMAPALHTHDGLMTQAQSDKLAALPTAAALALEQSNQDAAIGARMLNTADAIADTLEAAATGAPADLARIQASVSGYSPSIRRRRHIGTHIPGGRMGTYNNTTPKTYLRVFTTAQHFTQIQLIFGNASTTTPQTVSKAAVRGLSDMADPNRSGSAWTSVTFGGAASGVVPVAGGSDRRGYLVSDWIDYTSFPRLDGVKYPAISTRAYISTAGNISVFGNGSDVYTQWASRPDGRVNIMRSQDGDHVTATTGFISTTNENQSPIIGVRYRGAGSVITIMGDGDSITESVGSTYRGDGWGFRAAEALSDQLGIAVEWANTGWAGSFYSSSSRRVADTLAAGIIPDVYLFPNGSPNSVSTTIDTAVINGFRLIMMKSVLACFDYDVLPICWTMLPANYTGSQAKQYGATDSLRVAYNTETMGFSAKGVYAVDFSAAVSGSAHATGQIEFAAGLTNDGLHPNTTCEDVLRDALVPVLQPMCTPF